MSFVRCHCSFAGASYRYFVSDTIYSSLFSVHRLDKVATSLDPPPFAALDGHLSLQSTANLALASPPLAGQRAQRLRHWTAGFPRSRRLSLLLQVTPSRRRTAAGGDASAMWLRLLSLTLLFRVGSGFGFCGTTVMVVLARGPGCPSRLKLTRSQGLPIPADNFPNELARVCDSLGKSPAWRGLDAAFPSHFVMPLR